MLRGGYDDHISHTADHGVYGAVPGGRDRIELVPSAMAPCERQVQQRGVPGVEDHGTLHMPHRSPCITSCDPLLGGPEIVRVPDSRRVVLSDTDTHTDLADDPPLGA